MDIRFGGHFSGDNIRSISLVLSRQIIRGDIEHSPNFSDGVYIFDMLSSRLPKNLEQRLFDLTLALYRVTDFFPPEEMLRRHLRGKANEVFSQILEYSYIDSSESAILKILGCIQSVKGYLEIAKSLNIVKPVNLFVLKREYSFLADFFNKELKSLNKTEQDIYNSSEEPALEQKKESFNTKSDFSEKKPVVKEEGGPEEKMSNNPRTAKGAEEAYGGTADMVSRQSSPFLLNERQGVILEHLKQVRQAKISDFYSFFNDMSSKTIQRDLQDLVAKNLLKKEGEKRWTVYTIS